MLIFKTSGKTFESVIKNEKHAFKNKPSSWFVGEKVLISKNKKDCRNNEKQISYIMELVNIRESNDDEINELWPNNIGRWNYLAIGQNTVKLNKPFNLKEVLNDEAYSRYRSIMTFGKVHPEDEELILKFLSE